MTASDDSRLDVIVGSDPDALESDVVLMEDALATGCYVTGSVPQKQTALLHDWCVQWAEAGAGFCYIADRGEAHRDLLAHLPADRLADVVWIDYYRKPLTDVLDVPPIVRVALDCVEGPAEHVDTGSLETDPIAGRCSDWLSAAGEYEQFDWNVARIISVLIPLLLAADGPEIMDISVALSAARLDEQPDPLFEYIDDATVRTQLEHAMAISPAAFASAGQVFKGLLDPFPCNPFLDASTYTFDECIDSNHIVLVTGLPPPDDRGPGDGSERVGPRFLAQTVMRRLWEAIQSQPVELPIPLVIDGVGPLVDGGNPLLEELLRCSRQHALVPILSGGPATEFLPDTHFAIGEHVDADVTFTERATEEVSRSLAGKSVDPLERALTTERDSAIGEGPLCWVSTGTAGLLAANPQEKVTTRPAIPRGPPPIRHDPDTVAQAITDSVHRHGQEPTWLTEQMKREVREE